MNQTLVQVIAQMAVFLEFADEEREHLELLIREYRDLIKRTAKRRSVASKAASSARANA